MKAVYYFSVFFYADMELRQMLCISTYVMHPTLDQRQFELQTG